MSIKISRPQKHRLYYKQFILLCCCIIRSGKLSQCCHLTSWQSVCHGWCVGNKSSYAAYELLCPTPLSVGARISQHASTFSLLLFQGESWDWIDSLRLVPGFSQRYWRASISSQFRRERPLCRLARGKRRSRARERSQIWLSPSVNTKKKNGDVGKVPAELEN